MKKDAGFGGGIGSMTEVVDVTIGAKAADDAGPWRWAIAQRRTLARSVWEWRRWWSSLATALQEQGGLAERDLVAKAVTSAGQSGCVLAEPYPPWKQPIRLQTGATGARGPEHCSTFDHTTTAEG